MTNHWLQKKKTVNQKQNKRKRIHQKCNPVYITPSVVVFTKVHVHTLQCIHKILFLFSHSYTTIICIHHTFVYTFYNSGIKSYKEEKRNANKLPNKDAHVWDRGYYYVTYSLYRIQITPQRKFMTKTRRICIWKCIGGGTN